MKAAAKSDPACAPNVITYSALMTACCAGARPDKAYEVFRSMRSEDIRPDHISYSTLIAGVSVRCPQAPLVHHENPNMHADASLVGCPCCGNCRILALLW